MLNHCLRWTLLFITALCLLVPSQQAEGGEFLKRLFGRKCRKVCVPCPDPCVPFLCKDVLDGKNVCPIQLIAEVQYWNGSNHTCAFKIFISQDCPNAGAIYVHVPCVVDPRECNGDKCCEKGNANNCGKTVEVEDLLQAITTPIGVTLPTWNISVVPGGKNTYVHKDLGMGFTAPDAMKTDGVKLTDYVRASMLTYKAKYGAKFYILNRLTYTDASSMEHKFGIGYEVSEAQFNLDRSSEISDKICPGTPVVGSQPTKSLNFAEFAINGQDASWVWNYNVVEFSDP